ncbi:biotin-dependent carboxyltransferase family protein [Rossellomorea aquimaris]|uniref:5-oxoprolinase subunit C family protein n=1 Tax=Rossellomorea aquimaris TaxID=189382 RepID=UPI001CD240A7|nr:biotin-dependent carboxyltransferase family protein [Rossellomorea aquimaris]MCA1059834.1 biotin-dependent carboxyltransferase family protein [Rossellomorea aquimaris]
MINVIKPGLLTTIQDLGRYGYQRYGVIVSGSMDPLAHKISNLLVGNDVDEAVLEITLMGPVLEFEETTLISICGGDLTPTIDGKPVPLRRSLLVKAGSILKFGSCTNGCRSYLAVAGGFNVETVMNSRSTYVRAGIGGVKGRPLKAGDTLQPGTVSEESANMVEYLLPYVENSNFTEIDWSISSEFISSYHQKKAIRVIPGTEFDLFTEESREQFFNKPFKVSSQSDRMGYRLEGPSLHLEEEFDLISEAVVFGTIQVPSDGKPIILLADRQTTGGYPRMGYIASVDLPLIAQTKPGEEVTFTLVSHEEAQELYIDRERQLNHLKQGIALKFHS